MLTDLEAVALGCIERSRACSAYEVRRHFRSSPSSRFSDSAGSVYPMVRRLARRGLVAPRAVRLGRRRTVAYECTALGRTELRRWLRVPAEARGVVTFDPLRTRLSFLGVLSAAQRERWLADATGALERHAHATRRLLELAEQSGDAYAALAHENVLLQAEARLEWLRRARARLAASPARARGRARA